MRNCTLSWTTSSRAKTQARARTSPPFLRPSCGYRSRCEVRSVARLRRDANLVGPSQSLRIVEVARHLHAVGLEQPRVHRLMPLHLDVVVTRGHAAYARPEWFRRVVVSSALQNGQQVAAGGASASVQSHARRAVVERRKVGEERLLGLVALRAHARP